MTWTFARVWMMCCAERWLVKPTGHRDVHQLGETRTQNVSATTGKTNAGKRPTANESDAPAVNVLKNSRQPTGPNGAGGRLPLSVAWDHRPERAEKWFRKGQRSYSAFRRPVSDELR